MEEMQGKTVSQLCHLAPDVIAADIAQRYPSQQPYKIEKEMGGYEIDIPGYDLYYSSAGKFIRAEIDR